MNYLNDYTAHDLKRVASKIEKLASKLREVAALMEETNKHSVGLKLQAVKNTLYHRMDNCIERACHDAEFQIRSCRKIDTTV